LYLGTLTIGIVMSKPILRQGCLLVYVRLDPQRPIIGVIKNLWLYTRIAAATASIEKQFEKY